MTKIVILGGGLWGCLLAYFFHQRRPELEVELYERGSVLGGDHTWSFHTSDVTEELWPLVAPLVSHSWAEQRVQFPALERRLGLGYHTILSSDLNRKLQGLLTRTKILLRQEKTPSDFPPGTVVLDTRNIPVSVPGGWQNFVGLDVELEAPHGIQAPIIMDATVEQLSGFRFIYYLPWSPTRILVEDTRYTEIREIPVSEWKEGVEDLIAKRGWKIKSVERVEVGSLPIPFRSPYRAEASPAVVSFSGIFQDVTGYSIADALRVADLLSAPGVTDFKATLERYLQRQRFRRTFYRLLNRLMFNAADPQHRYRMLQHFYRLPQASIERFYAGRTTALDVLRVFSGKPPVSVLRAVRVIFGLTQEKP